MVSEQPKDTSEARSGRRTFFRWMTLTGAGLAALLSRRLAREARAGALRGVHSALPEVPGNELIRMQQDLDRALARPMESRRWVMLVDTRKCSGCQACVIACRAENVTGPEGSYRRVPEALAGSFPFVANIFMPTNCVQCDDPPCARAVPAGMIRKRADGIVEFDHVRLRGQYAQAVVEACPYRAVHVDEGKRFTDGTPEVQPYEKRSFTILGQTWNRNEGATLQGAARKCHFCVDLVEAATLPACVSTCIGGAMYFGDAADPSSLASEMMRTHRMMRVHQELGIQPRVYYVEEKLLQVRQYSCATCH